MRLYHSSTQVVEIPEIRPSNRTLDYGQGFYSTTSPEQAAAWVRRRMKQGDAPCGYVNVYDFDERRASALSMLVFDKPTEEWLDFVMANRMQKDFQHSYDIVYGPVANDRVYAAFALYEGGLLSKQNLIAELRTYALVDQYLFHTPQALQTLTFIQADRVTL